jgi:hypothetical protein
MITVAAVVPTAIPLYRHRDDGRYLLQRAVGCALAAPRLLACGELRGKRATYNENLGPGAIKGAS